MTEVAGQPESEVATLAAAIYYEKYAERVRRIAVDAGSGVAAPACFALQRQARREAEQELGLPTSEPEVQRADGDLWPDAFEQRFDR